MNTDRELMKQALEALEMLSQQPIEMALDYADNAIDALRKRLAQPDRPMIPDDFPREGLTDD